MPQSSICTRPSRRLLAGGDRVVTVVSPAIWEPEQDDKSGVPCHQSVIWI